MNKMYVSFALYLLNISGQLKIKKGGTPIVVKST